MSTKAWTGTDTETWTSTATGRRGVMAPLLKPRPDRRRSKTTCDVGAAGTAVLDGTDVGVGGCCVAVGIGAGVVGVIVGPRVTIGLGVAVGVSTGRGIVAVGVGEDD